MQLNQLPTEEREAALENLLGHHHECGEHCGHDHDHSHDHDEEQHEHGPGGAHAARHTHTADVASDLNKSASE